MNPEPPFPLWSEGTPALSSGVDVPTLTCYPAAPELASGAAMIVCPGGGYARLADHEGEPVARLLAAWGITAFVLRYRLGPHSQHPEMLDDAAQAMRVVRSLGGTRSLDPARVGILGFSAGGHLASTLATHYDTDETRPDAVALIYPVITLEEPYAHAGSRQMLLGDAPDLGLATSLSNHLCVSPQTPPCFLVHSADDQGVPVENSLLMASALSRSRVPYALHVFETGGHGYGLAENDSVLRTWPTLMADWLRARGFITCSPNASMPVSS